jgi:HD-GYP domain-containing protein (c-di-GMP phosphodiesterase class II)
MQKTLLVLGETLAQKDASTQAHAVRTRIYSAGIARNMNYSAAGRREVEIAAVLHDLGKVYIDGSVLTKPGPLTVNERAALQLHPSFGAELAVRLQLPSTIIGGIRNHHERWDGRGYPDGLRGENIPAIARLIAVADVYDALTSVRCYRSPMLREEAISLLEAESGTHFDPAVLRIFIRYLPALEEEVAEQVAA